MSAQDRQIPISSVLVSIVDAFTGLVKNEVDLARAEVTESAKTAAVAVGLIAAAMVIAFVALNVLTAALVSLLVEAGLHPGWAAVVIGGLYAVVSGVLVTVALAKLRSVSLAPKRTVKNLARDAEAVMGAAQ